MRRWIRTLLLVVAIVVVVVARYAIGNREYTQAGYVTEVFIVRGIGSLFMDFRLKLPLTIVTIVLIAVDWTRNKRPDLFWVAVAGTAIGGRR